MKWTISHIPENNIVHIETSGTMTADPLNQMVKEVIEAGKLHNARLYLVDHRNVHVKMSFIETVERPYELDRLHFPRNSRIAQVIPETHIELFRFLETVMLNRGYHIRVFKDIGLAQEWLTGRPPTVRVVAPSPR